MGRGAGWNPDLVQEEGQLYLVEDLLPRPRDLVDLSLVGPDLGPGPP